MKKIKYQMLCKQTKTEYDEKGEIFSVLEDVLSDVETDYSDSEYERILGIAYNGEVTVEDIEDPITEPTQAERFEAQLTYTAMMTNTLLPEEE